MKFTINRLNFINELNNVLRAVSSKTTIPILTGLKLVVTNDELVLTGSNADISIESTVTQQMGAFELVIDEPGEIVLPARFFSEIVKKLPDEMVTLEVNQGFQAVIKSGAAEFTVNGQDANNFPHLPEVGADRQITVAADVLREVVDQTRIAVSKQESRPILTGIHLTLVDGKLTAVATDSHRLAQRSVAVPNAPAQPYDVVIPGNSLTELSRMITDVSDGIVMSFADSQVLFTFGHTNFYSRLLEGNYPETDRLIPTTSETKLTLAADQFLAAIERASLLSHQSRNNVVKLTVKPAAGVAMISGNSSDVGNVEEAIAASAMTGNELEISFNPDYMRDALKSFGTMQVVMAFTSALRPFTLVPADDETNFIQLITPVRTY
ncbi:DNA polymerase III subunit beta [Limosilactobacillus equigenerosi]|uniref:Beta sliding clamp n=1 Tax=Limosilactobacillus equigenerosi DSM 18793 = JCM 14505 TaxID=1423742 RepID=A0A0R1UU07_9LACO|nr:DNA polymerase III subunit beta [Limosilactobacillus equigenerosi]KRL95130.1 DNA-directed DNA polymerase III beta subunit [Limosilactobacillus equigenerosi DSM 18793 = JCM 14505]